MLMQCIVLLQWLLRLILKVTVMRVIICLLHTLFRFFFNYGVRINEVAQWKFDTEGIML